MSDFYSRLSKSDAAVLLVDHQTGLISSLVRDYGVDEFKNNVLALANTAKFFDLPVILTTSFEDGPNGPLMQELIEFFPNAPKIARPGQINAWDNDEFVEAIEATGKKQLIIAGVVTDVCVAFPALSAVNAGYEVFVATDASGTFNKQVADAALMRMAHGGVQLMNWFSVAAELQRDWRNDVEGFGALLAKHLPSYQNIIGSYMGAQKEFSK
ncbi:MULTISPECIES: isochorismate family cysteine hydrolase YcaC [Bacillus]|uniref:isochorismate family cysteine hydrolase YcaC n=1 Tax=Bacillus TaxID=1386 RepID=UPI00032EB55A|nr:hydrolase [Bacillus wiedmannii]EOP10932.1 hydrolase [Bacillus cereus BAG2O-3]EOQ11257.1 hydrolase [Bacillus cereus B5-2]EOQ30459.1 hydrolase [Bacillus cereus BAG3O-1]MBJ8115968.1 hydrolase [Bacillus cereus]RFB13077.1 hydrolase [Bacillus sp. OE]RFB23641.1 hydrolase [Bacillus sp. LB(2018)]RFB43501.1 hydrolase [Bacillus sp. dmp10]RFB75116.1 hydrolase [Bacillus sp. AW]HDR8174012.1 hydrolase [Bacillus thuringiensis]